MKTIDFEEIYEALSNQLTGSQKKISVLSPLGVYFGYSPEGFMRLSFMSSCKPPILDSTSTLKVSQGAESGCVYWTCYDLLLVDAEKVFFAFCENLIESVCGEITEVQALSLLKKRYIIWKALFKRTTEKMVPHEVLQGLFGELYFMKKYMTNRFGVNNAVQSWSGPDFKSKDYAVSTEWFEVKTVGANANTVEISSLAQLSSAYPGHLVVIRAESMSDAFNNGESSIGELFKYIISNIDDEIVEEIFLKKVGAYGFDICDECFNAKFDVKSLSLYKVDSDFPRITEMGICYPEICNVSYSLIIEALRNYLEE